MDDIIGIASEKNKLKEFVDSLDSQGLQNGNREDRIDDMKDKNMRLSSKIKLMCFLVTSTSLYTCETLAPFICISCKLSPLMTICIRYQILYPEKNNKNISKCHLVNILPRCLALICIIKLQIQEVGKESFC